MASWQPGSIVPGSKQHLVDIEMTRINMAPPPVDLSNKLNIHQQLTLNMHAPNRLLAAARTPDDVRLIQTAIDIRRAEPELSFLHSALCAMSLPRKRPKDEYANLTRTDGAYSMMISPRSIINGKGQEQKVGIPWGAYARLILLFIQSEAVKKKSPEIVLGRSMREWMMKMGIDPSGRRYMQVSEQALRITRCSWTIRWQRDNINASMADVSITKNMELWRSDGREFVETLTLDPQFYEHLIAHAVPLNDVAIRHLKANAMALDLYVWLAFRLPRVNGEARLSWPQLAKQFGEYDDAYDFGKRVKMLLPLVCACYPAARVSLMRGGLILKKSDPAYGKIKLDAAQMKELEALEKAQNEHQYRSQLNLLSTDK